MSQAFTKLANAGILNIDNNNYKICREHVHEIDKAYKGKGGLFESANKGLKWLHNSGLEVFKKPKITVTEDEVQHAYGVYKSKLRKKG